MATRGRLNAQAAGRNATPNRSVTPTRSKQEIFLQMVQDHSCKSFIQCKDFVRDLLKVLDDRIQNIELEKFRLPCAAFQSLDAAR